MQKKKKKEPRIKIHIRKIQHDASVTRAKQTVYSTGTGGGGISWKPQTGGLEVRSHLHPLWTEYAAYALSKQRN